MANESKHLKISIEDAVSDALASTTNIDFEDTDFDTESVTEWVRPRFLGYSSIGQSGVQVGTRREAVTLSLDIFARVGSGGETSHRVYELADLARAAFDRVTTTVVNWSGAQDAEAYVYWDLGQLTPVGTSRQGDKWLQQVNVTWEGTLWA